MEMNNTCRVCKQMLLIQVLKVQNYLGTIYIYIYLIDWNNIFGLKWNILMLIQTYGNE